MKTSLAILHSQPHRFNLKLIVISSIQNRPTCIFWEAAPRDPLLQISTILALGPLSKSYIWDFITYAFQKEHYKENIYM